MVVIVNELVCELEELIAALDRRVPRVEQAGEAAIARDAAALRAKAIARLEALAPQSRPPAGDARWPSDRDTAGHHATDAVPDESV